MVGTQKRGKWTPSTAESMKSNTKHKWLLPLGSMVTASVTEVTTVTNEVQISEGVAGSEGLFSNRGRY